MAVPCANVSDKEDQVFLPPEKAEVLKYRRRFALPLFRYLWTRFLRVHDKGRKRAVRMAPVVLLMASVPLSWSAQQKVLEIRQGSNLLASASGKVVVLVFVRRDCPISGRYAPTIQRMSAEHRRRTQFYLVFPDKSESASQIHHYLGEFHYSIPAVRDSEHFLTRQAHAQFTPEAAVFNTKGALVYHGRIDNLYPSFGRARPAPTTHELEDAIHAAEDGRLPSAEAVPGVGCYISDLE